MPDSFVLTAPGAGTQVEFASYSGPPDFGQKDLLKAALVETPFTEGALSHELTGPRKMSFPLILRGSQSISNLGLYDQEALFRELARPGALLDLKPQGATTAVRFDVLSGRYEFDYGVHLNREGIRLGTLELETLPFGYWPTEILLASVASVALPGALTWAGSLIGDAPALFKIVIQPTVASSVPAGTWLADALAYSLTRTASHIAHFRAASLSALLSPATLVGEAVAVSSQVLNLYLSPTQGGWTAIAAYDLASALEPAHRGHYRAFGWFKLGGPPQKLPWYVSLDAVPLANPAAAFASAAEVATVPPALSAGPVYYGAEPTPGYALLDLGALTLPAFASGYGGGQRLRLWVSPATPNIGVGSPIFGFAGLYLLPEPVAVLPRGLAQPTLISPSAGRLTHDAVTRLAVISDTSLNLATANPLANALAHLRGAFPQAGSAIRLDLLGAARRSFLPNYANIVGSDGPHAWFRHEELAGPTLVDSRGSWMGSWITPASLGATGIAGFGGRYDGASHVARAASMIGVQATSWSIELWTMRQNASDYGVMISQGPNTAVGSSLEIGFGPTQFAYFKFADTDELSASVADTVESIFSHYVFTWDYATRTKSIWRNSELLASGVAVSTYRASGPIEIGRRLTGADRFFLGRMDEIAFYRGTAIGSAVVRSHYLEGQAAPTAPLVHSGPQFAAVSAHYRPRFQFIKGL